MPIYDYKCSECAKRFTLLMGVVAESPREECPHCGSSGITRLMSRFARLRSEDDIIESLADPSKIGDPDDPKELRSFMKRMSREIGDDLGDGLDELLDESMDETAQVEEMV